MTTMHKWPTFAISLFLALSQQTPVEAQIYYNFSLRAQQMGAASHPFVGFSLSPKLSLGNQRFQAEASLDIPTRALESDTKWAGEELRQNETVDSERFLGKFRLKSQPQVGSLGWIYAAANYYRLEVRYQNTPVFGEAVLDTTLNLATYGAGVFGFWEPGGSVFKLVGAEALLLTDLNTVDLWLELKTLVWQNLELGLALEAIQPKPQFTEVYFGAYLEYSLRW